MSWLSEAHNDWHTVNGWNVVCPLDCGAGEPIEAACFCGETIDVSRQSTCGAADCEAAHARATARMAADDAERQAALVPTSGQDDIPF